jgi:DNA-binding GntR family transcriptional regulator
LIGAKSISVFSNKLNIQPADKVSVLGILRYADDIPFSHTTSFLSAKKFPGIYALLNGSFSLYQLLEEQYGIEATRKSSRFEVSIPDDKDMENLQISPKTPLLVVKSLSESQDGDIVEYCLSKFRGDLCSITVDFNDVKG